MRSIRVLIAALMAGLLLVACNTRDGVNLSAALSGEEAVCEGNTCGGDATATAHIEINADGTELCYRYDPGSFVESGEEVTAAHIHAGTKGDVGSVVVDFISGNEACTGNVSESVLRDISEEPANFYVDIHTNPYPDGAARGQLELDE